MLRVVILITRPEFEPKRSERGLTIVTFSLSFVSGSAFSFGSLNKMIC